MNHCGNGATAGECAREVASTVATDLAIGVATVGVGKALRPLLRGGLDDSGLRLNRSRGAAVTTSRTGLAQRVSNAHRQATNSVDDTIRAARAAVQHRLGLRSQTGAIDLDGAFKRATPSGTARGGSVPDPVPVRRPSGAPNRDSPWYLALHSAWINRGGDVATFAFRDRSGAKAGHFGSCP